MRGIDVSRWQGEIDWEEVGRAGVRFAMIKATEGAEGADPCFSANINGAVGAGIACGTYHY
ncbi:MAG: glycoside hydrolase, partial [Clostridia bacterium]|nr:glycoside hydrolase [Clostridia bacterium]